MVGGAQRWSLAALLALSAALGTGCGQQFYAPAVGPGPERLMLSVQHVWSSTEPFEAWASAVVTWPNGTSQPVDHLQVWLRTGPVTHTAENLGRSEISVEARLALAPSEEPKSYACATYRGQTWCAGDPAARP